MTTTIQSTRYTDVVWHLRQYHEELARVRLIDTLMARTYAAIRGERAVRYLDAHKHFLSADQYADHRDRLTALAKAW